MIEERSLVDRIVDIVIYGILIVLALVCAAPFVHVAAKSLSGKVPISLDQVTFWPIGWNTDNYGYMMQNDQFLKSFGISVLRVALGAPLVTFFAALTAYPLSRDHLNLPGRTLIKFFFLFGMMFNGGLLPRFMTYRQLGLLNKFLVLVLPGALNTWLMIITLNFFRGIPTELEESARIDGASHMQILFRIFLPISTPVLATVMLFASLQHWNSWFDGIVFISKQDMWPLQSFLYRHLEGVRSYGTQVDALLALQFQQAAPEALKAAWIVASALPILCVYPFLQRYFVTGLTLGAVKE
jgi:putative aldouronate transport system permease protein